MSFISQHLANLLKSNKKLSLQTNDFLEREINLNPYHLSKNKNIFQSKTFIMKYFFSFFNFLNFL